ncbi:MAG TPA: hypothetical protein VNV37_03510 [Solirubrobacteraceae bacterium]|nr:hypothetical protein [Solirubrobacteraceae bacterium]
MGASARRLAAWLRASLPGAAAKLGNGLLTLTAGLAAAIPVISATVKAVQAGWVPVADRGIIATRAHDVFTSHMPLVGQYSLAGEVTGRVTHSLGPMLFWLLAPTAYNGSDMGMTVTMGAFNTLCIVGCVALARRRGGRMLMVMTAVAIALMCQSLAAETFHDVWNPSAGLFPFTLLIFLCWSLACGEHWLLPLTVLVASFVVQTHLTYLPPTLALLAVGLGGLTVGAIAGRRRRLEDGAPGKRQRKGKVPGEQQCGGKAPREQQCGSKTPREQQCESKTPREQRREDGAPARRWGRGVWRSLKRRRATIGWTLATLLVLAFCWSATIDGQLTEHPGNLTLVVESATKHKQTLGEEVGWHAVVRAVGIVPWWLQTPKSRWQRKYEVREKPSAFTENSTIAMLAALAVVALIALVYRRRDVATLALIALVLCPALAAVAASTPTPRRLSATLGYTMWWGSQAGMVVWLALAWVLLLVLAWAVRRAVGAVRRRPGASTTPGHASSPLGPLIAPGPPVPPSPQIAAGPPVPPDRPAPPRLAASRPAALGSVLLTLAGIGAAAAVGNAVAAQATPDEHATLYKPIKAIDARLAPLVPRGGSVVLEGPLDGATEPIKPSVRYFLVARGTRVLAPGSYLRLGSWYELYHRPYREAIYLSDASRPPVRRVPLAFAVSFREGSKVNTVYVWISHRAGR